MLTKPEIMDANDRLNILRFYPSAAGAQVAVMEMLGRMVEHRSQLDWLVRTMIDQVGEWRGPTELRGVYCTRFRPFDGIEANCSQTPGFRAADFEQRVIDAHEHTKLLPTCAPSAALVRQVAGVRKLS